MAFQVRNGTRVFDDLPSYNSFIMEDNIKNLTNWWDRHVSIIQQQDNSVFRSSFAILSQNQKKVERLLDMLGEIYQDPLTTKSQKDRLTALITEVRAANQSYYQRIQAAKPHGESNDPDSDSEYI